MRGARWWFSSEGIGDGNGEWEGEENEKEDAVEWTTLPYLLRTFYEKEMAHIYRHDAAFRHESNPTPLALPTTCV